MFTIYLQILFYISLCNIFIYSHATPVELTDTDNYLPPDDPKITNLMVSHYDCEKQDNLRQFILLNVKPCTEAPRTFNKLKFKPEFMFEQKLNALKFLNVKLTLGRNEKIVVKAQLNIDVLIEPYGTKTHYFFLSL